MINVNKTISFISSFHKSIIIQAALLHARVTTFFIVKTVTYNENSSAKNVHYCVMLCRAQYC